MSDPQAYDGTFASMSKDTAELFVACLDDGLGRAPISHPGSRGVNGCFAEAVRKVLAGMTEGDFLTFDVSTARTMGGASTAESVVGQHGWEETPLI